MTETVRCLACGAEHGASDIFCPRCGSSSSSAPTQPSGEQATALPEQSEALLCELQESLSEHIQIIRELGSGGMGSVFLGRDAALKRLVAIKVLHPQLAETESIRLRFEREAQAAAAVAHPNVVAIYQVGVLPRSGASYFVMQFVDGQTLADAFPVGKPAPGLQARRIVGETASALAAAHARGLVHRDIKPANIMIDRESGRAIVLDFGISAVLQSDRPKSEPKLTATGTSIGTPTYMSPEQAAAGTASDRSDVYSLGVVAFELLTGRPPFLETSPWSLMAAHIKEMPPRVLDLAPDTDPLVADLVDRALLKEPDRRPRAGEISRALLPERHAAIEWPPPGLETFRGLARRSLMLFLVSGMFALGYVTDLLGRAASSLDISSGESVTSLVFRTGPSVTLLVLAAIVGYGAIYYAVRAADGLIRARKLGYPVAATVECLVDGHNDTQDAINGYGRFALMSEADRTQLVSRRYLCTALLAAASWATAGSLIFASGRLRTWGLSSQGHPSFDLLILPFLLVAAVLWLKGRERISLGLTMWPRWRRRSDSLAGTTDRWLQARGASRVGRLPAPATAGAALGVTALGLLLVGSMPVLTAARAIRVQQMASNLRQLADIEELVHSTSGRYSSTFEVMAASSYGVSPGVTVTLDKADSDEWHATAEHLDGGGCDIRVARPPRLHPTPAPSLTPPHPARTLLCSYAGPPK